MMYYYSDISKWIFVQKTYNEYLLGITKVVRYFMRKYFKIWMFPIQETCSGEGVERKKNQGKKNIIEL